LLLEKAAYGVDCRPSRFVNAAKRLAHAPITVLRDQMLITRRQLCALVELVLIASQRLKFSDKCTCI